MSATTEVATVKQSCLLLPSMMEPWGAYHCLKRTENLALTCRNLCVCAQTTLNFESGHSLAILTQCLITVQT